MYVFLRASTESELTCLLYCVYVSVKNNNSLLFNKLNELNSIHRIIMTGVSFIAFPSLSLLPASTLIFIHRLL